MAYESEGEPSALEREIAAQVEEWSTNSTEATQISLYRGKQKLHSFAPEFTYPIFGDEEAIFGYRDLKIRLAFAAHNLRPHVDVSHTRKFPDQGEVKASDVHEALRDFLPEVAFVKTPREAALADGEAAAFVPPGRKVHEYQRGGADYEIWCASLADPVAKQIVQNMQILVPLFIEGGTMLELEHQWIAERWKVFFLYEIDNKATSDESKYSLAGYSTSYRVFTFFDRTPDLPKIDIEELVESISSGAVQTGTPLELPSRERISQFIILPPYQGSGHGSELYNAMFSHLRGPANVHELTVEDPNESFDDMRDVCDLVHLRTNDQDFGDLKVASKLDAAKLKASNAIPIDDIVDDAARERVRKSSKIMPRQLARLIEMQTLSKIPPGNRSINRITRKEKSSNENDRAYYFWRLYVKERLFVHNHDQLSQLDKAEQIEKLEQVLESLQEDYERLLALAEKREKHIANGGAQKSNGNSKRKRLSNAGGEEPVESVQHEPNRQRRKVAVVEDDDDE